MADIRVNHWRKLHYHDPAEKLRRLRAAEREVADKLRGADLDPDARDPGARHEIPCWVA